MKRINLVQGTKEWADFRRTRIGASDAPIIMGLSPWKTPFQLWDEKVNGNEEEENSSMRRGKELEPIARQKFNEQFDTNMQPAMFQSEQFDWQIASLDGYCELTNEILEIKCGSEKLHEEAVFDIIPAHYECQIQHQMAVTGVNEAYYCSYFPYSIQPIRVIKCVRDPEFIARMIEKEQEFYECLISLTSPPYTERDYEMVYDPWCSQLLREDSALAEQEKEIKKKRGQIKEELISRGNGKNFILDGAKIFQKTISSYDFEKMRMDGINLDAYKKLSSPFWQISHPRKGRN